MDNTQIKYHNMQENITKLYNLSADIASLLENITNTCLNTINNNTWNSIAAQNFYEQFQLFTDGYRSLEESIDRSILYLSNSMDSYYQVDREIKQKIADKFYFNETK